MESNAFTPLNTEWNRKTGILDGAGKLQFLETKDGIAYFTWTEIERGTIYLKCEEHFFLKNFRQHKSPIEIPSNIQPGEKHDLKAMKFIKYPFDVIIK